MSYWLEGGENQSHLLSQKPLHAEPAVEGWRPPSRAACYPEHGPLAKAQGDTLGQASSIKKPSSHGRTAEANKSAMLEATTKEIQDEERSQAALLAGGLLCQPGQAKQASWKGGPLSLSGLGWYASH